MSSIGETEVSGPVDIILKTTADKILRGEITKEDRPISQQLPKQQNGEYKQQQKTGQDLLEEAEARIKDSGGDGVEVVDVRSLRRLVNSLERKMKDNMEARLKHSGNPEKFMDSEVELDAEIKRLMQVSGSPELYPTLLELDVIPKLLQLMVHENSDIVADVVELLADLGENDPEENAQDEIQLLLTEIKQYHGIELLVERLGKLSEMDDSEAQTIHHILQLLSNIVELVDGAGDTVIEKTSFLKLLERRLQQHKKFYQNKGSWVEVIANTVAASPQSRIRVGAFNTMECLLKALHDYKGSKGGENGRLEEEEEEYIENLVDTLCYCLLLPENKTNFYNNEGIQLMILLIRKRSVVAKSTIRLLSYAIQNFPPACEMFVDHEGLKFLFALFMGKLKFVQKLVLQEQQSLEWLCLDMISNLLQQLPEGSRRDRVASKFVENEFEKCDRLLEIFWETYREMQGLEMMLQEYEEDDVLQRIAELSLKLQGICIILSYLWGLGDSVLNQRMIKVLHQRGYTLSHVGAVLAQRLNEVKAGLGSQEDQDTVIGDIKRMEQLLQMIGYEGNESKDGSPEQQQPKEPEPEDLPPLPPPTHPNKYESKKRDRKKKESDQIYQDYKTAKRRKYNSENQDYRTRNRS